MVAGGRAHIDAAGEAEVTVGEGGEYRSAIDFHAQAHQSIRRMRCLGLETQAGRIGMRADQAQAVVCQIARAADEGNDGSATTNDVVTAATFKLPAGVFVLDKTLRGEALRGVVHHMPGTGAGVDEGEQVFGEPGGRRGQWQAWWYQ